MFNETELSGYGWNWQSFVGSDACLRSNRRDLHKLDFVLSLFSRRKVAVQAGGNLGLFAKRLSGEFDAVYTFEPEHTTFLKLCANAHEANIIKIEAALGMQRGFVHIKKTTDTHDHEGVAHVAGCGIVPVIPLDDMELSMCDLLYLDVEGFETAALRGAKKTLSRCCPVVVAEYNEHGRRYGYSLCDLRSALSESGVNYVPAFKLYTDYVYIPSFMFSVESVRMAALRMSHIGGAEFLL